MILRNSKAVKTMLVFKSVGVTKSSVAMAMSGSMDVLWTEFSTVR